MCLLEDKQLPIEVKFEDDCFFIQEKINANLAEAQMEEEKQSEDE